MRKEVKYFIGEEDDNSDGFVIPDPRIDGGVIVRQEQGSHKCALDFRGFDFGGVDMLIHRSECIVTTDGERILSVQCSSSSVFENVCLERTDLSNPAFAHYERFRDSKMNEWSLEEGKYPDVFEIVLSGSIEPEFIGGFAAAMGHSPPRMHFVEYEDGQKKRSWRLVSKERRLP